MDKLPPSNALELLRGSCNVFAPWRRSGLPRHLCGHDSKLPAYGEVRIPLIGTSESLVGFFHNASTSAQARTLVFFHGNGEFVADYVCRIDDDFLKRMDFKGRLVTHLDLVQQCGLQLNALFVEYRGYAQSDGDPSVAALFEDCESIHAFLKGLGVHENQIVVMGRSIGSMPAIHFASRYAVAGLVLDSGFADPADWIRQRAMLDVEEESNATCRFSTAEIRAAGNGLLDIKKKILSCGSRPILVLHCMDDTIVPVANAHAVAQWASEAGGEPKLKIFRKGGHAAIWPTNNEEYAEAFINFIHDACGCPCISHNDTRQTDTANTVAGLAADPHIESVVVDPDLDAQIDRVLGSVPMLVSVALVMTLRLKVFSRLNGRSPRLQAPLMHK